MTPTAPGRLPRAARRQRPPSRSGPAPQAPGRWLSAAVLLALLLAAVAASLALGSRSVPVATVLQALAAGPDAASAAGEDAVIVWQLRVPRTALGLLAGAGLGVAGALMQGHTRNPLADPGLLGVTTGAGLAVVLVAVAAAPAVPGAGATVTGALLGAALGALVVVGLAVGGSRGRAGGDPLTLVLAGVAVSALLAALTQAVVLADSAGLQAYRFWAVGSVAGSATSASTVWLACGVAAVGLLLALAGTRSLDLLALGDDVARGAGVRLGTARGLGVAAIVLLTGAVTAACGPIAFVGLVVPHVARAVVGPVHRWLVPVAGLVGAVLVLAADVAGRLVAGAAEVPVGVVLAVLGGPAFVLLVRRRRLAAL